MFCYSPPFIKCLFSKCNLKFEKMSERLRYKGKFIKQKVLDKRLRLLQSIEEGRLQKKEKVLSEIEVKDDSNLKVGRRIIDVDELAKNLECKVCDETLSLKKIKKEIRTGLHSTFSVECKKCGVWNVVETGKIHVTKDNVTYADNNTKTIYGFLHAGSGCTALNKVLACANMPTISTGLYKRYEREIGPAIEAVAKESCQLAAAEERKLVIKKIDELCHEL